MRVARPPSPRLPGRLSRPQLHTAVAGRRLPYRHYRPTRSRSRLLRLDSSIFGPRRLFHDCKAPARSALVRKAPRLGPFGSTGVGTGQYRMCDIITRLGDAGQAANRRYRKEHTLPNPLRSKSEVLKEDRVFLDPRWRAGVCRLFEGCGWSARRSFLKSAYEN